LEFIGKSGVKMRYFEYLPKDFYRLTDKPTLDVVTNITSRVAFNDSLKTNSSSFYEYIVSDGETPEIIADKIYNNSNRHWIVLLMNNIINPQFDWPLDEKSLNRYIEIKYVELANGQPVLNWTKTNIKSYFRTEKRINVSTKSTKIEIIEVDESSYSNLVPSQTLVTTQDEQNINIIVDRSTLTYYTYETKLNQEKRKIKLLKPEFVELVEEEIKGIYK
jgi:hypothetical protein